MWLRNKESILRNFLVCFLLAVTMAEAESWLGYVFVSKAKPGGIVVRPLSKNGRNETHLSVPTFPTSLTFDWDERKMYWLDFHPIDGIFRANFDGTSPEVLFKRTDGDDEFITGIALDWITKNLYLALAYDRQIRVCDLSRQLCMVLIHDSKCKPFKIALHPQSGSIVWTNLDYKSAIFKASMDGSNPTQIIAEEDAIFGSVTIDHALSRLYWVNERTETVHFSDLDGTNVSTLESMGNTSIQAVNLAVTGPEIYWIDANDDSIKKCNKNDGSIVEVEKSGLGIGINSFFDMFFMGSGSQPKDRVNHCANHSCPHVCALTETSYRCLCPKGLTVSEDGHHCEDAGPKMLISTNGGTYILSMALLEMKAISNSSPSWGLSYDFQNSIIYWAGGNSGSTIFKSNLNGSGHQSVITVAGRKAILGLAYDWIAHNIYYTKEYDVGVCGVSGTKCAILHHDPRNSPLGIALFPRLGLMFWSTFGESDSIIRTHMDGSSIELIGIEIGLTGSLVIDNQDSQLYRLHESGKIITTDLDVKTVRTHAPTAEKLRSIAVGGDLLYWVSNEKIQLCNKYAYNTLQTVKEFSWNETVFEMTLFHRQGQLHDRINHCAGGLCSHICLLTQKYFRCICPAGLYLMLDALTCAEFQKDDHSNNITTDNVSSFKPTTFQPEFDNLGRFVVRGSLKKWRCAARTLVDLADLCNGTLGCPDGTDEGRYCDIPCSKINRTDDGEDCQRTPNGPQILCPEGYLTAEDKVTCKDVDECLETVCKNYCINTNGSYECRDLPESSEIEVSVTDLLGVVIAAAIPTIVAIAVVVVAIIVGVKYIQTRKILRRLTPEEVSQFLDGDENAASAADCGADKAMLMPFRLVLQPDSITIAKEAILGSGQFGIVYRGFYDGEEVAVKTFKRTVEIDEFKAVLTEAKIMAYIGDHVHVVRFIGADVSALADRKIVLLTELSPHGDLLGYLRKTEPREWLHRSKDLNLDSVTPDHLLRWCEEIACGMEHLKSLKIVHGDLAARNVLVFKENVVKITDFGLSKQLYGNTEYFLKRQRMLPWKWSALELLTRREFSTDSDIWAFGVTAWEIFSLGRQPYEEIAIGTEFIQFLEQGHRLPQPLYATTEIYDILKCCWDVERSSRPSFATLREFFQEESTKAGINNHVHNLMADLLNCGYTKV